MLDRRLLQWDRQSWEASGASSACRAWAGAPLVRCVSARLRGTGHCVLAQPGQHQEPRTQHARAARPLHVRRNPQARNRSQLQVFLGKDVATGDPVALKRIFLRRPQDGIPANVLREYMCLRQLEHRSVMRLLDVYPAVCRWPRALADASACFACWPRCDVAPKMFLPAHPYTLFGHLGP